MADASFDLIHRVARAEPERPALWFNRRWLSYGELDLRANRLAHRLLGFGLKPGDRVAVLAINHRVHIDLWLAAPRSGLVVVPFNHRLSAEETAAFAALVEPSFLFVDGRCEAQAEHFGCPWARLADYEDWLAVGDPDPLPPPRLTENDLHALIFTGGSTGTPKAARLPYRQTWFNAQQTAQDWGIGPDDGAIQATPLFHAGGQVLVPSLLARGGRIWLQAHFDPAETLRLVNEHRPSLLFMVPSMYRSLSLEPEFEETDWTSVRWAITGGAPCPPALHERYRQMGVTLRQGYGLTEAGPNCFTLSPEEAGQASQTVGRPLTGTQARVVDEQGQALPVGAIGELWLKGPHVCDGYWRRPEEWAAVYRDGWLATGDLARYDEQGRFEIVGRRKDLYISGGENVYPVEVEAAISQLPGVVECAVVGVDDEVWGQVGCAFVVVEPGDPEDGPALGRLLEKRLARYKLPRRWVFLAALPRTAAGKIDRRALKALAMERAPA